MSADPHPCMYTCMTVVACMAGHDEDPAKAAMGTPLERIMKMGAAMLEAVRTFKPPSSDGKKFEIRLGQPTPHSTPSIHARA